MNLVIFFILGALSAFGPLAIDFYLPAFGNIATDLKTNIATVQLSLSVYFIGVAFGQLIYGPLADSFGRKKPLLIGVIIFTIASFLCAMATSIEMLIGSRFLQALGGCAGMVISRAIVRDTCDLVQSSRFFSRLSLITGLAPMVAPSLGSFITNVSSWHMIFIVLGVLSFIVLFVIVSYLPETLEKDKFLPLSFKNSFKSYVSLLTFKNYMIYAVIGGLAMGGLFSYITISNFVMLEFYKMPEHLFLIIFSATSLIFMITAQINAYLVLKHNPLSLCKKASIIYLIGGILILTTAFLNLSVVIFIISIVLCVAMLGILMPNTSALAMQGVGDNAGAASALLGCLQFALAAFTSFIVSSIKETNIYPIAFVMSSCAVLCFILIFLVKEKPKEIV